MKLRTAALVLLLGLAVPAAAHARQSCTAPHSHTVAANRSARIYWQGTFRDALGRAHRRYYGCAYAASGRYRFNQRGGIGIVRLDGTGVLFTDVYSPSTRRHFVAIRVHDLLETSRHPFGRETLVYRYGGSGREPAVPSLVWRVGSEGGAAMAWIGTKDRASGEWEVRKTDALTEGATERLDRGPEIAPRSLRLGTDTVRWRHRDGSRHSADLVGG